MLGTHPASLMFLWKRGLFLEDYQTLLVADLHLGKDTTFRREGLAVPRGSSAQTLRCVMEMVRETNAKDVIILGDLFHARTSLSAEICELFADFLRSLSSVHVTLVKGNHDRSAGPTPRDWPLQVIESELRRGPYQLSHFPGVASPEYPLRIAGHTHPAVRLRGEMQYEGKLPCFHFDSHQRCLTLPAVGDFTGTQRIHPEPDDRIWVITGEEVIELNPKLID